MAKVNLSRYLKNLDGKVGKFVFRLMPDGSTVASMVSNWSDIDAPGFVNSCAFADGGVPGSHEETCSQYPRQGAWRRPTPSTVR